jgi:hypothetical protein
MGRLLDGKRDASLWLCAPNSPPGEASAEFANKDATIITGDLKVIDDLEGDRNISKPNMLNMLLEATCFSLQASDPACGGPTTKISEAPGLPNPQHR